MIHTAGAVGGLLPPFISSALTLFTMHTICLPWMARLLRGKHGSCQVDQGGVPCSKGSRGHRASVNPRALNNLASITTLGLQKNWCSITFSVHDSWTCYGVVNGPSGHTYPLGGGYQVLRVWSQVQPEHSQITVIPVDTRFSRRLLPSGWFTAASPGLLP